MVNGAQQLTDRRDSGSVRERETDMENMVFSGVCDSVRKPAIRNDHEQAEGRKDILDRTPVLRHDFGKTRLHSVDFRGNGDMEGRGWKYRVERFPTWASEAAPLFENHWREVANYQETVPLNFDYEFYFQTEEKGGLLPITARKNGKLCGYAIFMLIRLGHYRHIKCAQNDILYIKPEHRGYISGRFVKECEKICNEIGMDKIIWHVRPRNDWSEMLTKRGYDKEEYILGKMLR